jgi:hypothetical protein
MAERARQDYEKLAEKKRLTEINEWLRGHNAG